MDKQRLRNITTKRLHTSPKDIYEDVEFLTGIRISTLDSCCIAITALHSWLKEKVVDLSFWDGQYDPCQQGDLPIHPMNDISRRKLLENCLNLGLKEYKIV